MLPWIAKFNVECEFCNNNFFYFSKKYSTNAEAASSEGARAEAEKKMQKEQATLSKEYNNSGILNLNHWSAEVHACPKCGYTQSWMIKHAKNKNNSYRKYVWVSGVSEFLLAIPFLKSIDPQYDFEPAIINLVLQLLAASFGIVFIFSLYKAITFNRKFNPNAEILKDRRVPIKKNVPKISFLSA